jgi:hypothetical protein
MPGKSIANCAKHRNGPGTKPGKKIAPHCVRHRVAPGGIMCGACVPPSKSAPMVACPLAHNGCVSKNHPELGSCFASIHQAFIPCWPPTLIQNKNPRSSLPTAPAKTVLLCYPQKSPALKTTRQRQLLLLPFSKDWHYVVRCGEKIERFCRVRCYKR